MLRICKQKSTIGSCRLFCLLLFLCVFLLLINYLFNCHTILSIANIDILAQQYLKAFMDYSSINGSLIDTIVLSVIEVQVLVQQMAPLIEQMAPLEIYKSPIIIYM